MLSLLASLSLTQVGPQVTLAKQVLGVNPVAMAAAPTGSKFVASLENATIRIMNAADRMTIRTLNGHPQPAMAVAWSPNGKWIASGDESGRVFFWDANTGQKVKETRHHTKGVQYLTFNAASTAVMSTGKDDAIRIIDMKSGKQLKVVYGKGANLYGAKYLPGGTKVLLGTLDGGGTWILGNYAKSAVLNAEVNDKGVWDVDVKGNRAATAQRSGNVVLWNLAKNSKIQTLRGHKDWVVSVRFTPNGKFLASSSSDGTVRFWDANRMSCVATLEQQFMVGTPLCVTNDGKFLVTAGADNAMQVYSIVPAQK